MAFCSFKKTKSGFGRLCAVIQENSSTGNTATGVAKPEANFWHDLKKCYVKLYFSDHWESYAELISSDHLIQTKAETHNIERNKWQRRHWFARFWRRTCVVSRSLEMIDVTTSLFAWFHSQLGKRRLNMLQIIS